jgi:HPt (histidine-containing phosphotransfer) domain-containing protein
MNSNLESLKSLGANIDEAMQRFMNNESLYERMLGKFVKNAAEVEVLTYFDSGDLKTALENAHTLKGVTGNLSLTPLYKGYTEVVALLREEKPDEARKALEELLPVQDKIVDCIKSFSA